MAGLSLLSLTVTGLNLDDLCHYLRRRGMESAKELLLLRQRLTAVRLGENQRLRRDKQTLH